MFNALNGLGGAGQLDTRTTDNANTALYITFCIFSVAGGGIVNVFGVRYTTALACLTYALYTGSYIYYNHSKNGAFTITSGAILGIGAGILWTAQGVIMVSYPTDREKGKFISIFWIIFNLGGLIGGILPFAINFYHSGSLTDSVYAIFVVLEFVGSLTALSLAPPVRVIRDDGSHATIVKTPNAHKEFVEILKLFKNRWMLLLLPMSFTSNFFYAYQFSHYNGAIFTLRTRGFNNMLYWSSQIFGSYTKDAEHTDYPGGLIDFLEIKRGGAPIALYFCMGLVDSWYQNMAYWIIGTLTNDARITARYVGFYKGIQSFGAAISWQIGARGVPFLIQVIVNWALLIFSLPTMAYTTFHIKDFAQDEWAIYSAAGHKDRDSIVGDIYGTDDISKTSTKRTMSQIF
ncbi:hypothetical protein GGI12_002876 [Dipsacomyces acuminosporus]|nr:hypothetical protein GGI12_002876 [Dipsacomyces acuminosporus]